MFFFEFDSDCDYFSGTSVIPTYLYSLNYLY